MSTGPGHPAAPVVLVVDDPPVVEALARDMNGRYGQEYRLVGAADAESALALCRELRRRREPVALLLASHETAGTGGAAFLVEARAIHPEAGRVLLTTHPDVEAAIMAVNQIGLSRYLVKPWGPPGDGLYPVLDELLADWRARVAVPYVLVHGVMDTAVRCIAHDASLRQAAEMVAGSGTGDLMVVDGAGAFVGVLSEGDILRNALPALDEILEAGGTLYDAYQLFTRKSRELSSKPITPLVIRDPLVLAPDDHVAKAATVLIDRQIRRLPVVDEGRLVGTVSRADVCRAVVTTG